MKRNLFSFCIVVSLFSRSFSQYDSHNCTLVGRWADGVNYDCAVSENIVFLGNGANLDVVDFSEPVNPVVLAKILTPSLIWGLEIEGNYLYVADGFSGLKIFDISNPSLPHEIGSVQTHLFCYYLKKYNSAVYLTTDKGLYVVDVSDLNQPVLVDSLHLNKRVSDIDIGGHYLYLAGTMGMMIADVADPFSPQVLSTFDASYTTSVNIQDTLAYLVSQSSGVHIVNIKDAEHPVEIVFQEEGIFPEGVAVNGNYFYLAEPRSGLIVFDFTDHENAIEMGRIPVEGYPSRVIFKDGYAWVLSRNNVCAVDVNDPTTPFITGTYETAYYYWDFKKVGHFLLMCGQLRGIDILDVHDIKMPVLANNVKTAKYTYDIDIKDNYAFTVHFQEGLTIYDIQDLSNIQEIGNVDTDGYAYGIAVQGDYAYIADRWKGVAVVDISEPSNPAIIGTYSIGGETWKVRPVADLLYVAYGDSGLVILDISNPELPQKVGRLKVDGYIRDVWIQGNFAYLADSQVGLRIVDISDPAMPKEISLYSTGGSPYRVTASGRYAYVGCGEKGLRIIDIFHPELPYEVGYIDTGHHAYSVWLEENLIYLVDTSDGVYILRNDVLTWVNHSDHSFPFRFFLKQNYPNPFNPSTTIKFTVPAPAHVKLEVFNVNGQHVRTLVDETQTAGIHTVEWNGLTDTGECVSSGMYFYRLSVEGIFQERCAVLVR